MASAQIDQPPAVHPQSTFLRLPLEIRQIVYRYVLRDKEGLPLELYLHLPHERTTSMDEHHSKMLLCLLACRQVYEEARPIYDRSVILSTLCTETVFFLVAAVAMPLSLSSKLHHLSIDLNCDLENTHIRPLELTRIFPRLQILDLGDYREPFPGYYEKTNDIELVWTILHGDNAYWQRLAVKHGFAKTYSAQAVEDLRYFRVDYNPKKFYSESPLNIFIALFYDVESAEYNASHPQFFLLCLSEGKIVRRHYDQTQFNSRRAIMDYMKRKPKRT